MFIADNWKDYEVIDTSNGEKLERWGKYILVRPDPQVIWDTPKKERGWKNMNGHYHRSIISGGFLNTTDISGSENPGSPLSTIHRIGLSISPEDCAFSLAHATIPLEASTCVTLAPAAAHASVAPPV